MDTLRMLLPERIRWALYELSSSDDGGTIAEALQMGTAVAVSDGSLKDASPGHAFGTSAFVIEGMDSKDRITGQNIVPGPLKMGQSYRTELAGLIGIVYFINGLCKQRDITHGHIKVACDNQPALYPFQADYQPNPKQEEYDLVKTLWHGIRESPISWSPEHVQGHSNDKKKTNFTRLELLNIEMDTKAKALCWSRLQQEGHSMDPPIIRSHNEGWSLWHNDSKLASPNYKTLYSIIQDKSTIIYWERHNRYPKEIKDEIDWEASADGLTSLPRARRRWVTKHASENCGVGSTLVKWKKQSDAKCPCCNQDHEDTTHVLQCSAAGAAELWETNMGKMQQKLLSMDTRPHLLEAIMSRLNQWRRNQPFTNESYWGGDIVAALADQDKLGWKNLMECLPVKKWKLIQNRYFHKIKSKKSIKKWMSQLLKEIHNLAWSQWDHRNTVLHKTEQPRVIKSIQILNNEIRKEYYKGPADLPPVDRSQFRLPLLILLNRNTTYKQTWLRNVTSSRQRQLRRKEAAQETRTLSRDRSYILHWSRTGRVR